MKKGRNTNRLKKLIMIEIILAILLVGGIVGLQLFKVKVKEEVILEAGTKTIEVEDFLLKKNGSGSFLTDISALDLNEPGVYEVKIKVGFLVKKSKLKVVDTIPPTASIVNQMISPGETIEVEAFITEVKDISKVKISFQKEPDYEQTGVQEVVIILEDMSKNQTELVGILNILNMNRMVRVEAGATTVDINDFLMSEQNKVSFVTDVAKLDLNKPMIYEIQLRVDDNIYSAQLEVVDTIAPTATPVNREIWEKGTISATEFVTNIVDATEVSVTYKQSPDFLQIGNQEVSVIIEDSSKNSTELQAVLSIKADNEAPQIVGVRNKSIYEGEKISYKNNITINDNKDSDLQVQVDSSAVNLKKAGVYPVVYSVTDHSGNKAKVDATITVYKITQNTIDALADEIIAKIIKDSMTNVEKARAIYTYVKGHVGYTGSSEKDDWIKAAYYGIKTGSGDCFTYFALSKELLTKVGIDNIDMTRLGGKTRHYWNLVNCGDGWYHFDACRHKDDHDTFMLTDKEVEAYTAKRGNNYYVYDKSLYTDISIE